MLQPSDHLMSVTFTFTTRIGNAYTNFLQINSMHYDQKIKLPTETVDNPLGNIGLIQMSC